MTIVADDITNEERPGRSTGCLQLLLVLFLFIAGGALVFYFTAWRPPDRRKEIEPHTARAREALRAALAIPEDQNAWTFYREASLCYRRPLPQGKWISSRSFYGQGVTPETEGAIRDFIAMNRKSLALVKKGYSLDNFQVPRDYQLGRQGAVIDYTALDELSGLLGTAGDYALSKGRKDEALALYLQALFLGEGIARNGDSQRAGIGIEMSMDFMNHLAAFLGAQELPAPMLRHTISELQRLHRGASGFGDIQEQEMLLLSYDFDVYRAGARQAHLQAPLQATLQALRGGYLDMDREERLAENILLRAWESGTHPYAQAHGEIMAMAASRPILSHIAPGIAGICLERHAAVSRARCCYGGLLLLAAIRCYQEEKGAWPVNLAALVPGFLPALPEDPFSPAGTYVYRKEGNGAILYSIGEDLADNGGRKTSRNFYCTEDIVFLYARDKKK